MREVVKQFPSASPRFLQLIPRLDGNKVEAECNHYSRSMQASIWSENTSSASFPAGMYGFRPKTPASISS
jgi:hypothetical protein